ncbi:Na(+)/H(+) antiporter subunit D [Candidatus Marinamargulisbacteria bacterium SCGC AG-439-L15]|nr:Na(+)/H(+) antiporter subunit D [Candidatus Marinamargulisbacteria bacterium SCGC AG-439-L15]
MMLNDILGVVPPAFLLIIGSAFVVLTRGVFRNALLLALPILTFSYIFNLDVGASYQVQFLGHNLSLLRVDAFSKVFAYIFTISLSAAFLYGFYIRKGAEFFAALFYVGSALGVVFAGDLITLYLFWELMAISSVFLILLRHTQRARNASMRYILVHIVGGLVLLAGILLHISQTGSIAFTAFTEFNLASSLILIGFLINAAGIPLSSWLADAYPESSVLGGVILSAYTSKTAVYTLIRGFPGWDFLILMGCAMALYGLIYALFENNIRRVLSYSIINQVGFMVCAVGIGSPLALAGACVLAFCHIIYKSLLWMVAGVVIDRTGKETFSELGGLHRKMPLLTIFCLIAVLAISAPLTIGFISKSIIIVAAEKAHMFWPFLILKLGSVGVFFVAGIRFMYGIFFSEDKKLTVKKWKLSTTLGMFPLAFLCIYLGCNPEVLYNIVPFSELVKLTVSHTFSDLYLHHFSHLVIQLQMMAFPLLAFFLFLPVFTHKNRLLIDFDWIYRKGAPRFLYLVSSFFTFVNVNTYKLFTDSIIASLGRFIKNAPAYIVLLVLNQYWRVQGLSPSSISKKSKNASQLIIDNRLPVGLGAVATLGLLILYIIL